MFKTLVTACALCALAGGSYAQKVNHANMDHAAHMAATAKAQRQATVAERGQDMQGLAELQAARPGQIVIAYQDVQGGAELSYLTSDTRLAVALHRWFDAQLTDHGKDAMAGHAQQGGMKH